MGKTKEVKGMTLEEFFEQAINQAKIQAAAQDEVGKFLMAIVAEIGAFTKNVSDKIGETLVELEKEMEGRRKEHATREAIELMGRATAFGYVADQMTAMVDRLKEGNDATIH